MGTLLHGTRQAARRTPNADNSTRRALTLLEVLLATSITVMVGGAIVAMLGAVNAGVGTRRDTRSVMMRAAAARSRIDAYVAPCRCVLAISGPNLTLWLQDSRESQTVHASEIRWLRLNSTTATLSVCHVKFPDAWSQAAKDLEDLEYPSSTNWEDVLNYYKAKGLLGTMPLLDNVHALAYLTDQGSAMDIKHMSCEFELNGNDQPMPISIPATINAHQKPAS